MTQRNYYVWPEVDDFTEMLLCELIKLSELDKFGQSQFRSGGFAFSEAEVERAGLKLI